MILNPLSLILSSGGGKRHFTQVTTPNHTRSLILVGFETHIKRKILVICD
jgi:hypothetical protein